LKNSPQEFTLNRFKLASQRVYLAIVPHYFPFLINLYRLAKWQDKEQSLLFCAVSFYPLIFFSPKYILIDTGFLDYLVAGSFVSCFLLQFDNYFAEASISPLPESIPTEEAS